MEDDVDTGFSGGEYDSCSDDGSCNEDQGMEVEQDEPIHVVINYFCIFF